MSLDLVIEADQRLMREEVILTFQQCGVSTFVEENFGLSGDFPDSNMHFSVFESTKAFWVESGRRSCVIAEGFSEPLNWTVGTRIRFNYVAANFDYCSSELHQFIERLAQISQAYFVLSFQYENVYVVRDENGLRFFGKF
ncbi:hypothetical protein [Undibacterium sp.]|uniref:hypothetical protein n=1 Tax=Undibacterium sp. TaxID=1914977 RepID=UPI0025FE63B2|nr:hypothetical protein [Undibacterium sp.]